MDVTDLSGPSDGCLEVMKEMSVSAPENMEMSQPPVPPLNVDQRLQILSVDMPVNISPLKPESTEAVLDLEGEGCVSVNGHAADDTDEGSGEAGTDGNAGVQQNIDLKDIKPIQVVNSSGIIPEGQHFIIVTNDHGMFDTEEDSSNSKRIKMEGQNNETYFLTVSSLPVAEREIRKRPAKQPKTGCSAPIAPHEDVSQAWFTTKDDKNAIKNQGVTWKKGAWSKEEVEILQANIVEYCQSNSISDPEEIIFKTSKEMRKDFYRSIAKGLERPLFSVYRRVIRMYDQRNHIGKYSQAEMEQLKELRRKHGADWAHIGAAMGRSASSVKDKCRLMNDSCNSGKWLPEEETRLAQAVYELSGCQAGESITHGLSWSMVAEKVGSRSEKQCRTKWLNFLNWKVKGGAEWTREDDISLVLKISQLDVDDETDIDWQELAENWPSVRSPQWLRGKWWSIKRHVQDYQTLPFRDIVSCLHTMHMAVRLKTTNNMNMRVSRVDVPRLSITSDLSTRLPSELCITGGTEERSLLVGDGKCTEGDVQAYEPSSLLAGEGKATEGGLQAYEVMHHLTPTSSGTFLITHPQGKVESGLTSDSIIVHTLPVNSQGSLEGSQIAVLESPEDAVTSLGGSELTGIQLVQQGLSQSTLGNGDLQLSHQGEIIHVALTEASQEELAELGRSETVTSDLVMVNSASPQYVQAASNQGQLLSSLTDPMLTSQSSDLICSTSDAEGDKSQGHESDMVPIEN